MRFALFALCLSLVVGWPVAAWAGKSRAEKAFGPRAAVIRDAERVELQLLDGAFQMTGKPRSGWVTLATADAKRLSGLLLDDAGYEFRAFPNCIPKPGVSVRFTRGKDTADLRVCFECSLLLLSQGNSLYFPAMDRKMAAIVKRAFPADPKIKGLWVHKSLGPAAVRVAEAPKVELQLLDGAPGLTGKPRSPWVVLGHDERRRLSALLVDDASFEWDAPPPPCRRVPGVAVRFSRSVDDELIVRLCFECGVLVYDFRQDDPASFEPARAKLVDIVKQAFPQDPKIKAL